MLTIGSLFSGIGGLELGLEWAGLGPVLWHVEREPFCRCVLSERWPGAIGIDDVRAAGSSVLPRVDLICGGFPCQDVSGAGKGAGLAGERSGLWCEFARIVGELEPEWVVVENVASGAGRWLDTIVRDLGERGYACLPIPLSASDVGAPHRRGRIFVVAHLDAVRELQPAGRDPDERGWTGDSDEDAPDADSVLVRREPWRAESGSGTAEPRDDGASRDTADALLARREGTGTGAHHGRVGPATGAWGVPEPGVVPLVHGLPGGMAGRRRRARIRALGNAVVPQCAEVVGWVIREMIEAEPWKVQP